MEITIEQARALLQDAGAEDVSDEAAKEFADTLERYAGYVSEEAVALAQEDERAAVTRDDIVAAEE